MSWGALPVEVRVVADEVLTAKQLAAWKLELAGLSMRRVALHLEIARQTAADRIAGAHLALRRAGVRQGADGVWSVVERRVA